GDARGQSLDTARQRYAVGGFDDHVDVLFLDREVDDAARQLAAGPSFEQFADLAGDGEITHARRAVDRAQRHVEGGARVELRTRAVAYARLGPAAVVVAELTRRLAAGVLARPAPGRGLRERKLSVGASAHSCSGRFAQHRIGVNRKRHACGRVTLLWT